MKNYAVVATEGKQYRVSEGDVVVVDSLSLKSGDTYAFPHVLLLVEEGKRKVGKPYLTNVAVTAKVIEESKGKKVRVATFKAKARQRKVRGFRAHITTVKVESIKTKS